MACRPCRLCSFLLHPSFKTKESSLSLVTGSHGCLVGASPACAGGGGPRRHCQDAKCAVSGPPAQPLPLPAPSFPSFALDACLPVTEAFVPSSSPSSPAAAFTSALRGPACRAAAPSCFLPRLTPVSHPGTSQAPQSLTLQGHHPCSVWPPIAIYLLHNCAVCANRSTPTTLPP